MEPLTGEDPERIGDYRLLARLGAGGMGRVYLARTPTRYVAVKVIKSAITDDPAFRERFTREIALAERVVGPYTAAVLDADAQSEPPWLAAEFVAAPSLQVAVREAGPLPEASLRVLAAGLAEAPQSIHRIGIIHAVHHRSSSKAPQLLVLPGATASNQPGETGGAVQVRTVRGGRAG